MKKNISISDKRYLDFVREMKERITFARIIAARSVNRELILLYWDIGKGIAEKQKKYRWGDSIVEMLSKDLQGEFPSLTGFSPRNLWDMKRFYETYSSAPPILRQLVAELPWGHNILILQRVTEEPARKYYLEAAAKYGWSRNVLLTQIKACAYERELRAVLLTEMPHKPIGFQVKEPKARYGKKTK
jgi:predicted nuclease of restriction endonuclease-like (RecB) superfamily